MIIYRLSQGMLALSSAFIFMACATPSTKRIQYDAMQGRFDSLPKAVGPGDQIVFSVVNYNPAKVSVSFQDSYSLYQGTRGGASNPWTPQGEEKGANEETKPDGDSSQKSTFPPPSRTLSLKELDDSHRIAVGDIGRFFDLANEYNLIMLKNLFVLDAVKARSDTLTRSVLALSPSAPITQEAFTQRMADLYETVVSRHASLKNLPVFAGIDSAKAKKKTLTDTQQGAVAIRKAVAARDSTLRRIGLDSCLRLARGLYLKHQEINDIAYVPWSIVVRDDVDEVSLTATLVTREGATGVATPKLTIPVTKSFKIDYSAGIVVTRLRDAGYVTRDTSIVKTNGTEIDTVDAKYFVREKTGDYGYGLAAATHFLYKVSPSWGLGGMAGLSVDGNLANAGYLAGLSASLGRSQRVLINGGLILTQVKELSSAYSEGTLYETTLSEAPMRDVLRRGWFAGLSFSFGKKSL